MQRGWHGGPVALMKPSSRRSSRGSTCFALTYGQPHDLSRCAELYSFRLMLIQLVHQMRAVGTRQLGTGKRHAPRGGPAPAQRLPLPVGGRMENKGIQLPFGKRQNSLQRQVMCLMTWLCLWCLWLSSPLLPSCQPWHLPNCTQDR